MNNSFIAPGNSPVNGARPEVEAHSNGYCISGLVDLNRVVQHTFEEQQQKVAEQQAIVRCDRMPLVPGHVQLYVLLFRKMLGLILDNPPRNSKLFIYVKCYRSASDIIDLTLPQGFAEHEIGFYTNSNITPEWEKVNNDTLASCRQLIRESNGSLRWQTAPGAGCLFTVTLPGKIN